jgi:hypothetical protein
MLKISGLKSFRSGWLRWKCQTNVYFQRSAPSSFNARIEGDAAPLKRVSSWAVVSDVDTEVCPDGRAPWEQALGGPPSMRFTPPPHFQLISRAEESSSLQKHEGVRGGRLNVIMKVNLEAN